MSLERIKKIAMELMGDERGSHGWDHVERVYGLSRYIGLKEGADLNVLAIAAYLHDIGREEEKTAGGTICHAQAGADKARVMMRGLGYETSFIERVAHCIAAHRFRGQEVSPNTIEAKVLFDADKLDSIGAVGIGRAFLFAGEVGARLHNPEIDIMSTKAYTKEDTAFREFIWKLSKVKDYMKTNTGRLMAEERHEFMVAFFRRLTIEVHGEK